MSASQSSRCSTRPPPPLTGEAGDEVIAAVTDEQNAAARMLDKLLVHIGAPKGNHRRSVRCRSA